MEFIILDGGRMTSVEETHRYLARVLRLPAWYGGNLDALADCLGELGRDVVVVLTGETALRQNLGDYADRLLAVFEEISAGPRAFRWMVAED